MKGMGKGKSIFYYSVQGLKYLIIQGIIEILVILLFEYAGLKVLGWFSRSSLFIENVEGIAWSIGMKSAMFSIIYVPLFVILSRRAIISYSLINLGLNSILYIIYIFILRKASFSEVLPLSIATVLSSLIIVIASLNAQKDKK
jgi:hypothetical protein